MTQLDTGHDVLLVAGPGETQDAVLTAAAAQELDALVVTEADDLARRWRDATTVLISADRAEWVAQCALPKRERVFLVGAADQALATWSAPLDARVIPLPGGQAWLGAVLAAGRNRARAPVVAVVGGCGGVGASTLATALAQLAAEGSGSSALVDLDPLGGGIDLLLGAERSQGWRWPSLGGAAGQVGDLRSYLPVIDGVSVVSMSRGPAFDPASRSLSAIVGSLTAWHALVVLDVGRSGSATARDAVRLAGRQLLVVTAGVRGVAAARQTIAGYGLDHAEVVLHRDRGGLPSGLVEDALGMPVVAQLPTEPGLAMAAERGVSPVRGSRRGYRRAVSRLLRHLQEDGDGAG